MSELILKAPDGARKKKTIVGRGTSSGHGRTSGRGHKGQKSRSGGTTYVGFEGGQMPLYRRIARKGFSNKRFQTEYVIFNLYEIEAKYNDGETVNNETLLAKGLMKKRRVLVKVLGSGNITKKITVDVAKISASAKEKIEKVGGKVVVKTEE
ncbi:MAG TPA: 50S ribosomal protein L15 [Treponemataceae bacterium]|nr:50S ribosomal protein L15 [Treponemataceae bacterium]